MARDDDQPETGGPHGSTPAEPAPSVGADQPSATTMRLSAVNPADLTVAPEAPQSTVDSGTLASLKPGTALLRVDHGPNAGSRFLLDADLTTVGRHPSSDIFLDDVTVSRKHAQFVREGSGFVVRDVGSLNGTYVNRERIDVATVRTGDEVQIGKFRLVVHLSPAAP
jgi:pSer/pThr/pTyr-binding forkhead associated (FHA) protein